MLFKYAQTCIKTNGFVSKIFQYFKVLQKRVSNSAPCLHTTGRTCSLCYKGDSEIQGVKLPGGKDGEYIETKLCMFADDTQLFNKNDESVLTIF